MDDYCVIVGIDFGTTHSGFAYAHKKIQNIIVHSEWQEYYGRFKTPTVLLYDDEYKNVQSWGFSALKENIYKKPVELFKPHLGKVSKKSSLPNGLNYKKVITDYLHEIGKVVKQTMNDSIDFYNQVLIVLTVPAEFDYNGTMAMKECLFKAGLLKDQYSQNLKFITEPEAAAIHCMKFLKNNLTIGETFMVVNCGGGAIDSTTIQFLEGERLSVMTERSRDDCGDNFVDQEFLKFLERKVGSSAINLVKENHYGQLQYMIHEFCRMVKMEFTGIQSEFKPIDLDLDELCPILTHYCEGEYLDNMKEIEWSISLIFEDVKALFDPVIEKIIGLINQSNNDCTTLLLVGIFSESKYLQLRIKQEFSKKVRTIYIPPRPVTAIMEGAVQYGLLKWTNDPKCSNGSDVFESVTPYTNNIRIQLTRSFDIIQNLEEENKKFQEKYEALTNKSNKEKNQHQMIVNELKEEIQNYQNKIKFQEEKTDQSQQSLEKITNLEKKLENINALLEKEVSDLKNIHGEEKKTFQDEINNYKLLCNNLQEKYSKEFNEEKNQHQIVVKELNEEIKNIKERNSRDVQQIEQKHQNKIKSQEEKINQLQESLEKNNLLKDEASNLKNMQIQLTQSFEEEKKKFQDEINNYKLLCNNLQEKYNKEFNEEKNQHQMIVKELNEEIKNIKERNSRDVQQIEQKHQNKIKSQEEKINQLQQSLEKNNLLKDEVSNLKNTQIQLTQSFEKEKKTFQNETNKYKLLYNNLQEKYNNELNEEKNQHQIIVQKLNNNIKENKEQHSRKVQQLENQINNINQQYQSKFNLLDSENNNLRQLLKLKENQEQILPYEHIIVQKSSNK